MNRAMTFLKSLYRLFLGNGNTSKIKLLYLVLWSTTGVNIRSSVCFDFQCMDLRWSSVNSKLFSKKSSDDLYVNNFTKRWIIVNQPAPKFVYVEVWWSVLEVHHHRSFHCKSKQTSEPLFTPILNRRKDTRPVEFPSSVKIDISQPMDVRM